MAIETIAAPMTQTATAQTQDWQVLQTHIQKVRRRHQLRCLMIGTLIGLAVFAAAFLGFALADVLFKLSNAMRTVALTLSGAGILISFLVFVFKPWQKLGSSLPIARNIENTFPELEQQLSTALEFGRDQTLQENAASPALVQALIQQTKDKIQPLDLGRAINWKAALWAGALAFLLTAGIGIYRSFSPRLFQATWGRFINPTAQLAAPTLTVIKKVTPENHSIPMEGSVKISAHLEGVIPSTVTLSVCIGDLKDGNWEDRLMEPGKNGVFTTALRRLLDEAHYQIKAGDAVSETYTINVFREPQVDEFTIRIEHPSYTGRKPEVLPPGVGAIRALNGTRVLLKLKANTPLSAASLSFSSDRASASAQIDGRQAEIEFIVKQNERYQIKILDFAKRPNRSASTYRIEALTDAGPKVRILKPQRDLMIHKDQEVRVEISASDDVGVREVGIYHSLEVNEEKTMVKRFEPTPERGKGYLKWELSNMALKGGEVIAYYAYALDNDTINGPKMARSELHFITVYDEKEYDSVEGPKKKAPPTPKSVRRLDKMIDTQKVLLKETFALSSLRATALAEGKAPSDREIRNSKKTAKAQRMLKKKLEGLIQKVKSELSREPEVDPEAPKPEEGEGPEPPKGKSPLSEKEIKHMEESALKMGLAADALDETKPTPAVPKEIEALRHLSETRRLLLSDKEGDPRFKMAMDKESKKNSKKKQSQQQKDQKKAREELSQLPPMMEREKKIERELETLEEKKRSLSRPKPQNPDLANEREEERDKQRRLKRQIREELDQLAEESKQREENLRKLADRNREFQKPAESMREASEQFKQANKALEDQDIKKAQQKAKQGARKMDQARRGIRDALQKQLRQEMSNLQRDARELAQRQAKLSQQTRQQKSGKPSPKGQPKPGQPAGKPSPKGQPKPGESSGKPSGQDGKPSPGSQQSDPSGKPSGQQSASSESAQDRQKRLSPLASQQGNVSEDLKDMASRLQALAERARNQGNAGSQAIENASKQAKENSPAEHATEKATQALRQGKTAEAEREQWKAERALEAIAQQLKEAVQKTAASDMRELATALKTAKDLAQKQQGITEGIEQKRDPSQMAKQEEKIADAAHALSANIERLETLKRQGRARNVKEQLRQAAKQANKAASALEGQDTKKASTPAKAAEKALQAAVQQMDRSLGKTLEQKAKDALAEAKASRTQQEKANKTLKQVSKSKPSKDAPLSNDDREKLNAATEQEREAARQARRLEKSLEGLEEMARESNPVAAMSAEDAKQKIKENQVPREMGKLVEAMTQAAKPSKQTPKDEQNQRTKLKDMAKKGEALAKHLKDVESKLNQFLAEATGDQLSKLKATQKDAQDALKKAQQLTDKDGKPNGEPKKGKTPAEKVAELKKALKNLKPKLERLEPSAPERAQLKKALQTMEATKTANPNAKPDGQSRPQESQKQSGGQPFKRIQQALESVSGGLSKRIERILKARDIRPDEDEEAPKEYSTMVEDYYRALSEDMDDE